jgi:hypothetical protein
MHHEDDNKLSIEQRPVVIDDIFYFPALVFAAFEAASLKRTALIVAALTQAVLDAVPVDGVARTAPVTITPLTGTALIIASIVGATLRLAGTAFFLGREGVIGRFRIGHNRTVWPPKGKDAVRI